MILVSMLNCWPRIISLIKTKEKGKNAEQQYFDIYWYREVWHILHFKSFSVRLEGKRKTVRWVSLTLVYLNKWRRKEGQMSCQVQPLRFLSTCFESRPGRWIFWSLPKHAFSFGVNVSVFLCRKMPLFWDTCLHLLSSLWFL